MASQKKCHYCHKSIKDLESIVTVGRFSYCSMECVDNQTVLDERKAQEKAEKKKQAKEEEKKLAEEDIVYRKKITDYIQLCYPKANFPMLMLQLKSMMDEYDLTHKDVWLIILYAQRYEAYEFNPMYGMRQYDKFIFPAQRHMKEVAIAKTSTRIEPRRTGVKNYGNYVKKVRIEDEGVFIDED